jgi:Sigma-70, region 4
MSDVTEEGVYERARRQTVELEKAARALREEFADDAKFHDFVLDLFDERLGKMQEEFAKRGWPHPGRIRLSSLRWFKKAGDDVGGDVATLRGAARQNYLLMWKQLQRYACCSELLQRMEEAWEKAAMTGEDEASAGLDAFFKAIVEIPALAAGHGMTSTPFHEEKEALLGWLSGNTRAHLKYEGDPERGANLRLGSALEHEHRGRKEAGLKEDLPGAVALAWEADPERETMRGFSRKAARWIEIFRPDGPPGRPVAPLLDDIAQEQEDGPEARAIAEAEAEQRRQIQIALLSAMPAQTRNVFRRHLSGERNQQIATNLHLSISTVKAHLETARKIISRKMANG